MDEPQVSKIFYTLAAQAQKAEGLSPEDVQKYCTGPNVVQTFFPELLELIGVDKLFDLIFFLGGKSIYIPSIKDIETARKG